MSKEVDQAIPPAIQSLVLPASYGRIKGGRSLLRLLRRATQLRRLDATGVTDWDGRWRRETKVLAAVCDASVGNQLQSLSIKDPPRKVIDYLKAGGLPCLTEPNLERFDWGLGGALVKALEARRALGLPPLTRLTGLKLFDESWLGRAWACCPPHAVTHLEAIGADRCLLKALSDYMLQQPMPTLRSLELRFYGDEAAAASADDWRARQGHAPALETLKVFYNSETLAQLGQLLGEGKLPRLSSLKLTDLNRQTGFESFGAFMYGLEQHKGLRRLSLELTAQYTEIIGPYLNRIASAIKSESGGLALMEELHLGNDICSMEVSLLL